jgi:hypothetical protein
LAIWGISCRWYKILHPPQPRPPIERTYLVNSVENGAKIAIGIGKKRVGVVILSGIAAPAQGEPLWAESRDNLARLAGNQIRVEIERHGIFRGTEEDENADAAEKTPEEMLEGRQPIVGVVYGESGACCQLEQITAGLEMTVMPCSVEWNKAEKEAKKEIRGIWK